jgi:putative heme-binding domain-containing protein
MRRSLPASAALVAALTSLSLLRAEDDKPAPASWTQTAEVLPLVSPANPNPTPPPPAENKFTKGPVPQWIWGPSDDKQYRLSTKFYADAKSASLFISCDNSGTVFINGKKVASDVPWDSPKTVDVTKRLKAGENEIVAEVANADGVAGFLCKLVISAKDGSTQYVVSDDSWKAAEKNDRAEIVAVRTVGKLGDQPWYDVISGGSKNDDPIRGMFHGVDGFQVERIFTVDKDQQGSWVSMTIDPQGRVIASSEGDKGLYRITPAPIGSQEASKIERIPVNLTSAQGLLCAFGNLYVSVNGGPGSGLYKVRDTNNDDQYDEVAKLAEFRGGGEHGPHALKLSPDGQSIYVVCGNHTLPPAKIDASRMSTNWKEDLLLPRMWDANGHAVGILAPGGWVAKTDPEGKTWEMISSGYRNSYDMDFNADGELFVYDADMEWDVGSPWYRPTRVNHATSGSELGWRSGTGKWPSYYVDSLPPLAEIGPGSPVGVAFGYGAKFPAKYQKALFILDWTFGTIYTVHLQPDGSSYKSTVEEFLSRTPLPLTDCAVGPDGAFYFTIGGRGTQSELFRVTYVGQESTGKVDARDQTGAADRELRHKLEAFHSSTSDSKAAVAFAWPYLSHGDRFIRFAARLAIEKQPIAGWKDRVGKETEPDAIINGVVALARMGEASDLPAAISALGKLKFDQLDERRQLDLLRAYELSFARLGQPADDLKTQVIDRLDPLYPAKGDFQNRELCNLLVYLKAPSVVAKTIHLIETEPKAPVQKYMTNLERNAGYGGAVAEMLANQPDMQKIHYAFDLRNLHEGWTMDERKAYFGFLDKARKWSGGASFRGFLRNIDHEAFEPLPEKERLAIEASGARKPDVPAELPKPVGPGHEWTFDEVVAIGQSKLKHRNIEKGKRTFAAAKCVLCHRFGGDGGATGPDLTLVAGRFNLKDLTDSIVNPSKVISDQYKGSTLVTTDGRILAGRVVAETADSLTILVNPEDATKIETVAKADVEEIKPSTTSIMPADLLKTLNEDEVLDLMAFLLSRGNAGDKMFEKKK